MSTTRFRYTGPRQPLRTVTATVPKGQNRSDAHVLIQQAASAPLDELVEVDEDDEATYTYRNVSDMLTHQRVMQQASFGYDFTTMTVQQRVDYVRWNILALEDELHEALAEVSWKPWAKSQHFNSEAFIGELIDAWHFLMNLFLVTNADPDEFAQRYWTKAAINAKRQRDGYDGVSTKCRHCGRALDDPAVQCTETMCLQPVVNA